MLSEHLLQECEVGQREYEECPKSGLAVKKSEMKTWKEGPNFKAKPAGKEPILALDTPRHGRLQRRSPIGYERFHREVHGFALHCPSQVRI
jgi:hypothetical protein